MAFTSALAAAVSIRNVKLTERLIEAGANVNKPVNDDYASGTRTALQLAADIGHLELVNILLRAGADANALPNPRYGATALQCAALGGYLEIASVLVRAGAHVNAKGAEEDGQTALEGAAEHGHLEMVHFLLDKGARLRGIYNSQYRRAMAFAGKNGCNAVARFIESVHRRRIEQANPYDKDDGPTDADISDTNRESVARLVDLGSEQASEEPEAPGFTSALTQDPVDGPESPPRGQVVHKRPARDMEIATGGEPLILSSEGTVDTVESVEIEQTYRELWDPEHLIGEDPELPELWTDGS